MRTLALWTALILISHTAFAWALDTGRSAPANPCPLAHRYCQARAPESGLPHDYPPRVFLTSFRTRCALTLMTRLRQRAGGLFNPAIAPRVCGLMAQFLGATPGEWRALMIVEADGSQLKTTPAGKWPLRCTPPSPF